MEDEDRSQGIGHWALGQKKLQCSVLCDTLMGKDKSLEGKTVAEIASQGIRVKAMGSKKDSHPCLTQGQLRRTTNRMMTDADVSDGVKGHCLDWRLMVKCGTVVDFRVCGRSSPSNGNC